MSDTQAFRIGRKLVGKGAPCFVVAELSGNHHQKYEEAEALVRAAAEAGADAVKIQTYTADTMTIDSDKKWFFLGGDSTPDSWKKGNLHALYRTAYTPWEWQPKLKVLAESLGLVFFSTPFDETAVDFLEKMGVPCYKVASYEATHVPLLKKIASTGKPVIISIGFASRDEAAEAVATLRENGSKDIAVLHCVTAYADTPQADAMNLSTMRDIAERFNAVSGFSDNNGGIEFPIAAVYAGASVLEKHLILDKSAGGPDARFSIEPAELRALVEGVREAERALGSAHYGPTNTEEERYRNLRRSLFAVEDIQAGEAFTRKNVRVIRPAYGLAPKYIDSVLGRTATKNIERGTPLSWELVKGGKTA